MHEHHIPATVSADEGRTAPSDAELRAAWGNVVGRRSFLKGVGLAGVAAVPGGALFASEAVARSRSLTAGDAAILRFLAAVELIESDLWVQYNELGGVKGGNSAYMAALSNLDSDMPQYISDNTDDELSHAAFLNAYLRSKGAQAVNLDEFRKLPSSKASGARQIGRLTNLNRSQSIPVGTCATGVPGTPIWERISHRLSTSGPAGDPAQRHRYPARPAGAGSPVGRQETRMQAIANTAGLHFAYIEQGGSSLYSVMALKATSLEVLRIIVSIGGVETNHFSLWHDKAGNAVAQPLAGVTDPETGVTFPISTPRAAS